MGISVILILSVRRRRVEVVGGSEFGRGCRRRAAGKMEDVHEILWSGEVLRQGVVRKRE